MVRYYCATDEKNEYIAIREANDYLWFCTSTPHTINENKNTDEGNFFSAVKYKEVSLKYIKLNGYYENFKRYYQQHK